MPTPFSRPPSTPRPAADEIERLLDGLADLARQLGPRSAFFSELLDRALCAVGGQAGIVWTATGDGRFQPEFHQQADRLHLANDRRVQTLHEQVLGQLTAQSETVWIAPGLGRTAPHGGAASGDQLLSFTPLRSDGRLWGVLELGHEPVDDPALRRGAAGVLEAFAAVAVEFHERSEWRDARQREQFWRQVDQFSSRVHSGLSRRETAAEIVNEARRLLEVDRVTLIAWRHERARAEATSGVERIERRSETVRGLERLASAVLRGREPLWYGVGRADALPPQLLEPLERHLEQAPARCVIVYPLTGGGFDREAELNRRRGGADDRPATGALVLERFSGEPPAEILQRLPIVARQAATAWTNAIDYSTLPFVGAMRALRNLDWIGSVGRWPWAVRLAALLVAAGAAAAIVPAEHTIEVRGALQPRRVRDVFATVDGEVAELFVKHEARVRRGQRLLALRSTQLELDHRKLIGDRDATREKLVAVESARLAGDDPDGRERSAERLASALSGSAEELRKQLESLEKQLEILDRQRAALDASSPLDGAVLTWKVEDLLADRPVQRGQLLLSIADVDGPWELRLEVPDRRFGHLLEARRRSGTELPVTFALAAAPGRTFAGQVREIWEVTEPPAGGGGGSAVARVVVDFDRQEIQDLRPGATVLAKIHCGRRSLGYVWFHGVFEAIQAELFF